jgi:hypothetical protein
MPVHYAKSQKQNVYSEMTEKRILFAFLPGSSHKWQHHITVLSKHQCVRQQGMTATK